MKWFSNNKKTSDLTSKSVFSTLAVALILVLLFTTESVAQQDEIALEPSEDYLYIILQTDDGSNLPAGVGFKFHPSTTGYMNFSEYIISGNSTKSPHSVASGTAIFGVEFFQIITITVPGYFASVSPSNSVKFQGEDIAITVTFHRIKDCDLAVDINADGGPGSFSITGPAGFTPVSGQTSNYSSKVVSGAYTVTFTTPPAFDLAVSATSFTVGSKSAFGTLESGDTETVEGVYSEHMGKLQGFIEPIAAWNEGGQWRLKNASGWRDSGNVAGGIPIGTYTVEFKAVGGWTKPSDAVVTVEKDETTSVTGIYTERVITGSLEVFINDNNNGDVINAGAQWRPIYPDSVGPTSNTWYDGGHIITGIPVGDVGIEFNLVNGYVLPDLCVATIRPGVVEQKTGEYIRPLIIHKSDYDGNGTEDLPVFNQSTRVWSVASVGGTGPSATKTILEQKFGFKNDIPATGDYDGDSAADLAVYREKAAKWIVHRQFTLANFGQEGDIPVPGDYNGDGTTDPALYRPDTGEWLIRDMETSETTVVKFGGDGYIPVPGNFDGDKNEMTDLGIYHVQNGQWKVAIYHKTKERWTERKRYSKFFGSIGDIPMQADYNGDGTTDHAYYDRTENIWHVLDQFEIQLGRKGVIPVPNDWAGLGRVIPAYFNPATGRWQAVDNLLRTKFGAGCCPLVSGR